LYTCKTISNGLLNEEFKHVEAIETIGGWLVEDELEE
jgi:hypothetical protein